MRVTLRDLYNRRTWTAADRYTPTGPGEDFWGEPLRTYPEPVYKSPGPWTKPERGLRKPKEDYKYPDLWETEWTPGPAPSVPDSMPNFDEMSPVEIDWYWNEMKTQIEQAVMGAPRFNPETGKVNSQQGVPKPCVIDLTEQYLRIRDPEAAEQLFGKPPAPGRKRDPKDDAASDARFGYKIETLLNYLLKNMPIEDMYLYWNSIVNDKVLPLVNHEFVENRYCRGQMGRTSPGMYNTWKEKTSLDHLEVDWPEEENQWVEGTPPEWFSQVQEPVTS